MKQARKNHTIGLAGGVLSVAGLCVGILSIGKKADKRYAAARMPLPSQLDPTEPSFERDCVWDDARLPEPVEVVPAEPLEAQAAAPDKPVTSDLEPVDANPVSRSSREMIADLARHGQPVLAIAQALGISIGEVQLTLKLQERTASAVRTL